MKHQVGIIIGHASCLCCASKSRILDLYFAVRQCSLKFFSACAEIIVFEWHIFMPKRLNFFHRFHPKQQRNQSVLILTLCRSTYIQSLLPRRKSRVQRLDFRQMYITCMTLKITARQLETAARRFFATCTAAQLRRNIAVRYITLRVAKILTKFPSSGHILK